ncbi:hypothetical protein ABB37_10065 [Leptomonas pyrrhocoris]|uniref:Uncharacterized protein n=1 Tax=Leptomonas pyrrhocoris TaxID=157538 RepID=A0A0M9FP81_LEPPY|nr:hypothetical protein ABB37_10065 [Leptomonas pyrrhocoris]XP_015651602.1 hypothetical protein ABB37_10065 [Leptomonas pyrrhocoris]KPA73162.1 hypothetical protein ABB37_10065 [Leptomonas pyrrhocoris]KPA73163.1 hypothetical protein ABB37_10065 [Leptomonas pyrrhocoris]|eukprot:XP_015651601.1 hypothetical protein ABB37_10065 [Leptomonas pyrrhocoris]
MGPRVAGFLVGGFVTASVSAALFHYDFLRKQEVTNKKTEEVALQADIIVNRFRVIESGLRTLSKREEAAAAAAAAAVTPNTAISQS